MVSKFGGEVIVRDENNELFKDGRHSRVEAIVYLDPTDLTTECNEELALANVNENGSPTGIKSGCMKWYAYKDDGEYYTMILDHNTTANIEWIKQDDYEQTGSQITMPAAVGIEYLNGLPTGRWYTLGTNNRGPITLLNQLKIDTSNWVVAETLTEEDKYTAEWTANKNDYYNGNQKYTINYNGYNARLISAEEINEITGKGTNAVSNIQNGSFDDSCSTSGICDVGTNKYGWLFDHTAVGSSGAPDCTIYGCNGGNDSDTYYWTSSADTSGYSGAWFVFFSGDLYIGGGINSYSGVRPIIKVSKSKLSK